MDQSKNCAQSCPVTRWLTASSFVTVVVLFLLVNIGIGKNLLKPHKLDKSWAGWAVDDFIKSENRPNVVFLGSSLMLVPLAGNDANYLNKKLDGSKHHHCTYFQDTVKQKIGYKVNAYNFALPGEMPSDAYLVTNFLLKDEKRPDVIIYGVGPRDFMDNLLPSPSATDPFRAISDLGSIDDKAGLAMPDWQTRLEYEMGKYLPIYGKREIVADEITTTVDSLVDNLVPSPATNKPFTVFDRRTLLPEYRRAELEHGEAFFRPETAADKKRGIFDNLAEYRKRYKELKWGTFLTQMQFFADFLNTARDRNIEVIVMAMPITEVNRSLLTDRAWHAYLNSIKALAQAKGATFIDLHNSGEFQVSDFMDTVHLSPDGGKKMLDYLVSYLRTDSKLLAALDQNQRLQAIEETKTLADNVAKKEKKL